jgi:hypothetical protein
MIGISEMKVDSTLESAEATNGTSLATCAEAIEDAFDTTSEFKSPPATAVGLVVVPFDI